MTGLHTTKNQKSDILTPKGALKTRVNVRKHSFFNENVNRDMITRNYASKAKQMYGN
jgi:hypothetical protein